MLVRKTAWAVLVAFFLVVGTNVAKAENAVRVQRSVCAQYSDECCGFDCDIPFAVVGQTASKTVTGKVVSGSGSFESVASVGVVVCEDAVPFGCRVDGVLVNWEHFVAKTVGVPVRTVRVENLQVLDDKGSKVAVKFRLR